MVMFDCCQAALCIIHLSYSFLPFGRFAACINLAKSSRSEWTVCPKLFSITYLLAFKHRQGLHFIRSFGGCSRARFIFLFLAQFFLSTYMGHKRLDG
ncbi:hypothetical protein L228DRAFT_158685 [Xylona heveae TC161]|uniref:Uncharacterized protein n=1 Tax=Xylona heveae (strain CBS 132557 / TC161) TaxID=1328760 RepID=A0A165G4J6_XYLHT|nr:hypothetical protein L228DRAFT_158685 [Xylona heveae TC161]KZF21730.1 hypothetical protein L228DRAFT_158685 [Xylona heveae TC161]